MRIVAGLHMSERAEGGRIYLVEDGSGCVLVDTGAPDGTLGAAALIQSARRELGAVRLVLLTHAHRGHAGNAEGLRALTGAPLAASAAAAARLAEPASAERRRPGLLRGSVAVPPARVDRVVEPGEVIDLCGGIEVLDAGGHAPGAAAFHVLALSALFAGDAVSVSRSGAVGDPPLRRCLDPDAARRSADRLVSLGARVVAPGHGYPSVGGRGPRIARIGP